MSVSVHNFEFPTTYSNEVLEEAKTFNGRRIELRKLVDAGKKPVELLEAHTQLMLANRDIMKGILFEAKLGENKVYLLGTFHVRLMEMEKDLPVGSDKECASKVLCQIIHPLIMEILNQSNLYVELDVMDPETVSNFRTQAISNNLIIKETLPKLERSQLIEDTANKTRAWGLDIALIVHQYKNLKKVYALESVEEQIEDLKIHAALQRKDPKLFLFSGERKLESLDAAQWNNLDSVVELDKCMPQELLLSLAKRNLKMTEQIFTKLSSGENGLFAMGTSHFSGEQSILSLLKERHVQLKQIFF